MEIDKILDKINEREKRTRKRSLILTMVPIITAVVLIIYTTNEIADSRAELKVIKNEMENTLAKNRELTAKNDSLKLIMKNSSESIGRVASLLWNFRVFIDRMEPNMRSYSEASFFINFRMFEEKIRGEYQYVSDNIAELPDIKDDRDWIVIVDSNKSFEDLKLRVDDLVSIYGKDQVAIYKDANDFYALSVIGNGTFTRAYRLNVELRDIHGFGGAYFRGINNWGKNYLEK